jgi:hypothetical protein
MLVKAIKVGFIGGVMRSPNDEPFDILEASFSKIWMEKVGGKSSKKPVKTVEETEQKAYNIVADARYNGKKGKED